ncbi:helix-turn-helix DNA binding domain protein [Mycobacterium Phage Nergal]|nr:helix-turn-helix DNA binding domain protein [Mycobacterium Phage Nergal]
MTMTTMTVRQLSAEEMAEMARGKQVRIDGRVRTIPALNVARFENMCDTIEELYAGEERAHERAAAIKAAALYLCDDLDATGAGDELEAARTAYEAASAAARIVSNLSIEDGASESRMSRELGVDRLTVRKWRGKQDRR